MNQLGEIVGALQTMPPLPQVAQRVLAIVSDPDYSVDELVLLIRTDPTLTARILRLCNSAQSGRKQLVGSVADAVAYLGTRNLVKLVLVSCTATHFASTRPSPYADPVTLWQHTLAVAMACQWLARRCGFAAVDTAFTAGILHNLGKIVLSQLIDPAVFPAEPRGASHTAVEQQLFGIDHATAAGIVVDAWGLPRDLRRAVRAHHDAEHASADDPLPAILELACTLVLMAGIGNPFPGVPLAIAPATLSLLHLQPADVDAATAHVIGELQRSAELLNLGSLTSR